MHDERLKAMIPPILDIMYSIQTDLYQHLYASVHEYATSHGLTNTDDVVEEWVARYDPIRIKGETDIKVLREGKTARTPIGEPPSKPGLFGRKSSSTVPTRPTSSKPGTNPPPPQTERKPSYTIQPPTPPVTVSSSVSNGHAVYGNSRTTSSSSLSGDAAKKKPPPPPPPKPSISPKPDFVIAKYDFGGESAGDLAFRVGDRIKVIKKTESLEDWWEGELHGQRGMFPRNYCE